MKRNESSYIVGLRFHMAYGLMALWILKLAYDS